jgi:hypothetical protein
MKLVNTASYSLSQLSFQLSLCSSMIERNILIQPGFSLRRVVQLPQLAEYVD